MSSLLSPALTLHQRNLVYFISPGLWPNWPFLPLVRRTAGREEEYGVVFDAFGALEMTGLSSTVFLSNFFEMPAVLDEVLELPKETYDTPDEIFAAGWRVD